MEKIPQERGDQDAWICLCGNTPDADGFYPCDPTGAEIEPTAENAWNGLYICNGCGRIINQATLEVVPKEGAAAPSPQSEI
jgi:hypothetical protein